MVCTISHCTAETPPHSVFIPVAITLLVYTCTAECVSAKGKQLTNEP